MAFSGPVSVRVLRCLALAAALSVGLASAASAQEMTATRKAGRGLAGLTLGILELPGNITQEWRNDGPLQGLTVGLAMGLVKFPSRTLLGAYELITAPFPLPAGYEPLLAPAQRQLLVAAEAPDWAENLEPHRWTASHVNHPSQLATARLHDG